MPACVFCGIADGSVPASLVLEDDDFMAFLDARPVFLGHTLVIPRAHHETLLDLPPDLLQPLFARVKLLAAAVPAAMEGHGSFVAINNVVSQSVPHLHVHVVPRRFKDGLRGFMWPRTRYENDEQAADIARAIRSRVEALPAP